MKPSRSENPGLEEQLPEAEPMVQGYEAVQEASMEAPQETESASGKQSAAMVDQSAIQLPVVPNTVDPQTVLASTTPNEDGVGAVSDDSDKIDQQWIDRTKSVITQTQDDPYVQKNKMSEIKADYIKQRFNKIIKTGDALEQ